MVRGKPSPLTRDVESRLLNLERCRLDRSEVDACLSCALFWLVSRLTLGSLLMIWIRLETLCPRLLGGLSPDQMSSLDWSQSRAISRSRSERRKAAVSQSDQWWEM